jgi:hypothetical protein
VDDNNNSIVSIRYVGWRTLLAITQKGNVFIGAIRQKNKIAWDKVNPVQLVGLPRGATVSCADYVDGNVIAMLNDRNDKSMIASSAPHSEGQLNEETEEVLPRQARLCTIM